MAERDQKALSECCLERELLVRIYRARGAVLSRALSQILRVKSLERAKEIATVSGQAEWMVLDAVDGLPVPPYDVSTAEAS